LSKKLSFALSSPITGALTDGGSVIEWITQLLNIQSDQAFEDCVEQVEELVKDDYETANPKVSLTMVPFLSGERSTGFRTGATGVLFGLTRETSPAHVFRSCMEGVTLRLLAIISLLRKSIDAESDPRIIASGQALEANALWRQMLSDSTGLTVLYDDDTQEGTSRGVALLIAHSFGLRTDNDDSEAYPLEVVMSNKVSKPAAKAQAYWRTADEVQRSLIDSVSHLYKTPETM
jgi:gluconokinase